MIDKLSKASKLYLVYNYKINLLKRMVSRFRSLPRDLTKKKREWDQRTIRIMNSFSFIALVEKKNKCRVTRTLGCPSSGSAASRYFRISAGYADAGSGVCVIAASKACFDCDCRTRARDERADRNRVEGRSPISSSSAATVLLL
jgi:hypothetical protein